MTARKGKPEQNSPNGTSKMGQKDDSMQIRNARTDCQDKLPVHYCQYRTARTGLQCGSAKTGLPGQEFMDRFCYDIALILALSLNLKGL
jgi:hypothetical protein